jgi:hypothetical protein
VTIHLNVLAIIPARGGSKGVPGKNIRELAGKPLIAYSIEAALESEHVDHVVVSTEDEQIAAAAREWGSEVVPRPPELATDTAPTDPVLEHAVTYLEQLDGYRADLIVLLQPTSPLRPPGLIDACIERYLLLAADGAGPGGKLRPGEATSQARHPPGSTLFVGKWQRIRHPAAHLDGATQPARGQNQVVRDGCSRLN